MNDRSLVAKMQLLFVKWVKPYLLSWNQGGICIVYNPCAMFNWLFRQTGVPREYRRNFLHLYLDIAWFGVVSGSAINFLNIYVTRLGASGFQIGLLGAVSGVVSLILAIPAGRWLERRRTSRAIFWTSVLYRLGYTLWIPLPWLFSEATQIWVLITITCLMAIPLTPLGVGFNALFAEAVPLDWRAHVAGIRNVTLAITFIIASLISGYILNNVPFPLGYQIIFSIGTFAAALSSYHLYFIKSLDDELLPSEQKQHSAALPAAQPAPVKQPLLSRRLPSSLRLDIWQTPYRNVLLVLLGFHLAQYLAIPIFPLFNVHILNLNDSQIGIGTSMFYLTVLLGSTQFGRLVRSMGHRHITGWGVFGMGLYPLLLAFSSQAWHYYGLSLIGGWMWAMVGAAYANYMLERIPSSDRPTHLAWYTIMLNTAILAGSLLGPVIAVHLGLQGALILFALARFAAGFGIVRWG